MLRVYLSDWNGEGELPALDREERHHLFRVRRVRPGEMVEVLNGRGAVGRARIAEKGGDCLDLRDCRQAPQPDLLVHLAVAVPKGKTFPALLHRAVELGVAEVTPLLTEHVEPSPERLAGKTERLEAVLIEAVKQSGNPWKPVLHSPTELAVFLKRPFTGHRLCAALEDDTRPLGDLLWRDLPRCGAVQVLVGPEGDFSPGEYRLLRESDCLFASLGPLVLKVETAVTVVLGALRLRSEAAAD
jgi:16S rRNA (uracil1498-N3)-methyltransferase